MANTISLNNWGIDSRPYTLNDKLFAALGGLVNLAVVYFLLNGLDIARSVALQKHLPMPAGAPHTLLATFTLLFELFIIGGTYYLKTYEDKGNMYLVVTAITGFIGVVGSFVTQLFVQTFFMKAALANHITIAQWARTMWIQMRAAWGIELILLVIFLIARALLRGKKFSAQRKDTTKHLGSAQWASSQDIKKYGLRVKKGCLLGKDSGGYLNTPTITDRLIMAYRGGGKTSSVIIPFILDYPHVPKFILDIKGELTAVTARKAKEQGRKLCVLDPFGVLKSLGVDIEPDSINPFASIKDMDPSTYSRYVSALATALSSSESAPRTEAEYHFAENATIVLEGVLDAYLSGSLSEEGETLSLPGLHNKWLALDKDNIKQMKEYGSMKARVAATQLLAAGDEERGSIQTTVYRRLQWLRSDAIVNTFSGNSADIAGFVAGDTDIYVILPEDAVRSYNRMVRVVIAFCKMQLLQAKASELKDDYVFVLDELGQFGYCPDIVDLINTMRSRGVKVWSAFQTIDQIEKYQEPTVFTGMPIKHFLGNDDLKTMEWIQKLAGKTTVLTENVSHSSNRSQNPLKYTSVNTGTSEQFGTSEHATDLLPLDVIREMLDNEQILFLKGKKPIRCEKAYYFKESVYDGRYDSNPLET